MKKSNIKFYINPIYWPLWFFYGVIRLLILLPFRVQLRLGKWLGRFIGLFSTKSKRTARVNIDLCFSSLSQQARMDLLKKNDESVGVFIFEVAMAFWGRESQLKKIPFRIKGVEHYHAAMKKGAGCLMAGPHFTCLELLGRLFSLHYPFAAMYRQSKVGLVEHLLRPALDRHYVDVVERSELRKLLSVLKRNLTIWYAVDVDAGVRNSVFVPFMGVLAATMTAPARLAKKTGAVVMPTCYYREGSSYVVEFFALPDTYPTGDASEDARKLNDFLTEFVSSHPEQYFWQYKRFKTRPKGEARLYGSRSGSA